MLHWKIPRLSGIIFKGWEPYLAIKSNVCTVNQKIVTAWFSGNVLISMEPLIKFHEIW